MKEQTCGNCKWHIEFTGACTNGDSENCADFTTEDDTCEEWENKEKN